MLDLGKNGCLLLCIASILGACSRDGSGPAHARDDAGEAGGAGAGGSSGAGGNSLTGGSAGVAGGGTGGSAANGGVGGDATGGSGNAGGAGAAGGSAGASGGGASGAGGVPMVDAGDAGQLDPDATAGGSGGGDAGMDASDASASFTPQELLDLGLHSPLPDVPADPTNAVADNPAARTLGQRLFFDAKYSGALKVDSDLGLIGETGKISCATCHTSAYMDDQRSSPSTVSLGAGFHARNAPTVINASYYQWTNWGGRFSAQWELPMPVAESGVIMNSNRLRVVHRIFDAYKTEYEALFGTMDPAIGTDAARFPADAKPKALITDADGVWELSMTAGDKTIVNTIFANYGKVLASYMRTLVSKNAAFDDYIAGDDAALTNAQKRGAKVFVGKGQCSTCHSGPHFSDDAFHNLGVPQTGVNVPASDDGRFKDVPPLLTSIFNTSGAFSDDITTGRLDGLTNPMPEPTRGAFRTPDLRGAALTAPYMHSGQIATLAEVVDFYDAGGATPVSGTLDPLIQPLGLTAQEKGDLVAFLGALTGDAISPALLVDTSAP